RRRRCGCPAGNPGRGCITPSPVPAVHALVLIPAADWTHTLAATSSLQVVDFPTITPPAAHPSPPAGPPDSPITQTAPAACAAPNQPAGHLLPLPWDPTPAIPPLRCQRRCPQRGAPAESQRPTHHPGHSTRLGLPRYHEGFEHHHPYGSW